MPIETDYEIKCRGCPDGEFVPLKRKDNRAKRFYYNHAAGCKHHEDFDPDVQDVSDLKRLAGVEVRLRGADAPKEASYSYRDEGQKPPYSADEQAASDETLQEKETGDVRDEQESGNPFQLDW
nr:hypothetical protein 4 [Moraxellaceae bacterium]